MEAIFQGVFGLKTSGGVQDDTRTAYRENEQKKRWVFSFQLRSQDQSRLWGENVWGKRVPESRAFSRKVEEILIYFDIQALVVLLFHSFRLFL